MSTWIFSCHLGLAQDTCGQYTKDKESRGYAAGIGGCCSCQNREAYNAETTKAEMAFELKPKQEKA